jgi:hypothetical protein
LEVVEVSAGVTDAGESSTWVSWSTRSSLRSSRGGCVPEGRMPGAAAARSSRSSPCGDRPRGDPFALGTCRDAPGVDFLPALRPGAPARWPRGAVARLLDSVDPARRPDDRPGGHVCHRGYQRASRDP